MKVSIAKFSDPHRTSIGVYKKVFVCFTAVA